MLVLLLLLALVHPSRQENFDATRCMKEMVCIVPEICASNRDEATIAISGVADLVGKCAGVVAIRPYTPNKWLVIIRGKGVDAQGIRLALADPDSLLFQCRPNGNQTEIAVGPSITKEAVHTTYVNETENYAMCEFEVSSNDFPNLITTRKAVLSYSVPQASRKTWKMASAFIFVTIDPKKGCNPYDIQFDSKDTKNDKYLKVDGRKFEVSCPPDFKLSANQPGPDYAIISKLACAAQTDDVYKYQVTAVDQTTTHWVDDATKLSARCSQKRCISCPEVSCGDSTCKKPVWTKGLEESCARLECKGEMFSIRSEKNWLPPAGEPECLDGQWEINGTKFTEARCVKDVECPPLKCDGCTVSKDTISCTSPDANMTITSNGVPKVVSKLTCNRKTGKWAGAPMDNPKTLLALPRVP